jgi:hypothetical protein
MEGSEERGRKGKKRASWETHWLSLGRSEKKNREDGAKCVKPSHWMRRSRMTDQQGRWTEDDLGSGKIQH